MAPEATRNRPLPRQKIRMALLVFSFVLMPVTFAYVSCPLITEGASQGIATGGLFVFTFLFIGSLFVGRLWCGYLCPAGGLQEIYTRVNGRPVTAGWLNWLKYPVFLGIYGSIALAIYSAGGLWVFDPFYQTGNGISIDRPGGYALLYGQIIFITVFALLAGRRGFCHTFCPIAVMLILGRKIRNFARWPALHLAAAPDRCTGCGRCSRACPMSLDVRGMVREGRMEQTECLRRMRRRLPGGRRQVRVEGEMTASVIRGRRRRAESVTVSGDPRQLSRQRRRRPPPRKIYPSSGFRSVYKHGWAKSMQICIISGSPKGEKSVTLQYVRFLEQAFPEHTFAVVHAGREIRKLEQQEEVWNGLLATVKECDGVLWATPVYCLLIPAQLKRFIELVDTRNAREIFSGKYTACLTTSIHYFDHTAHAYLHGVCDDLGMRYVGFYSAHMQDLQKEMCQEQLIQFFSDFLEAITEQRPIRKEFPLLPAISSHYIPKSPPVAVDTHGKRVVILHDAEPGSDLAAMVGKLAACYAGPVQVAHIRDSMMKGACLGCCRCAFDNTCIHDDGFRIFWEKYVVPADILIMAGTIRDRFFSATWKQFFDRSFFGGHVPVFRGKQIAYLVEGSLGHLANLRDVLTSLVMTEEANLAGIVTNEPGDPDEIDAALHALAERSVRLSDQEYIAPVTFPAVGGHKLLRDELWGGMRATFKADDRYYRQHGLYDFPTRDYLRRIGTRVTSLAMSIPAVRRNVVKNMPDYMVQPLQRAIESSTVLAKRRAKR